MAWSLPLAAATAGFARWAGDRGEKTMKNRTAARTAGAVLLIALAYSFGPSGAEGQTRVALDRGLPLEARVWLDRGEEPLLQQGDQVRVYYRAAEEAYVAIFHIDTDGTTMLAFPHSPDEDHYVRGGRDYRLLFPRSPYWYVDDAPGVGYYFIVASDEPFDFRSFRFSAYDRGWDLSLVGRQVYRDPYVAMDDYIAALLPDWRTAPYALDFTTYNVGQRHEYPRFLCYECHTFRAFAAWNPYYSTCTDFRVVIYDDPYFYPARRYRGDRVVWAQPPTTDYPRFAFKERGVNEPSKAILSPRPTSAAPSSLRPATARRSPENGAGGVAGGSAGVVAPSNEPTNLGTFRGRQTQPATGAAPQPTTVPRDARPTPLAPTTGTPRPVPTRPTDGARGGVAVPGTGGPPASTRAEPAPAAPADTRQRPVLQRRPPEGTSAPAPSSPPARGTSQPNSGSGSGSGSTGRARPTEPPASPPPSSESGGGRSAQPRATSGSTESSPPPASSGGSEQPAVRRTPDGRPVVR